MASLCVQNNLYVWSRWRGIRGGAFLAILAGLGCASASGGEQPGSTSTWAELAPKLGVDEDAVQWARALDVAQGEDEEKRWRDRFSVRTRRAAVRLDEMSGHGESLAAALLAVESREAIAVMDARRVLRDMVITGILEEEPPPDEEPQPAGWPGRGRHTFGHAEGRATFSLLALSMDQDEFRRERLVDGDGDGEGEFATMPELVGAWPLRRGKREAANGEPISDFGDSGPWYLEKRGAWNWAMNPSGTAARQGYVCSLFLPSGGKESRWQGFGPRGGTLRGTAGEDGISVALSESRWCAYLVPQRYAVDGKRAFFVHHTPVVNEHVPEYTTYLWCENEKRMSGDDWVDPDSALLGRGVMAAPAVDKVGMNGEKWNLLK